MHENKTLRRGPSAGLFIHCLIDSTMQGHNEKFILRMFSPSLLFLSLLYFPSFPPFPSSPFLIPFLLSWCGSSSPVRGTGEAL